MTKEEIIELAKKADLTQHENPHFGTYTATTVSLMRFAKLVAEKERDACTAHAITAAEKAIDVAIKLEREECAKICEEPWQGSPKGIAEQIRARSGNQK